MMHLARFILTVAAVAAVAAMVAALFVCASNLPTVYESWSMKECVRVDDPAGRYSCEHLPPKFNHEWTE